MGARFRKIAGYRLRRTLRRLTRRVRRRLAFLAPTAVWLFAVVIGFAGAGATVVFRTAVDVVSLIAFGETERMLVDGAAALPMWRAALAPVLGGVAVGALSFLAGRFGWLEGGRPQGVADVIEARAVREGRISARAGLAAATISAVSLGAGASAGREGPAVHLGAAIASLLDRGLGFSARDRRTLLGCGAAAAVAASFNAPIAGVLFALEVVMGAYAVSTFGPISVASVTAALAARAVFGDRPAFAAPDYGAVGDFDVPMAAALGIVCGLIAAGFIRATVAMTAGLGRFAARRRIPLWALPAAGGVVVGAIGAALPEVFGVGYQTVTNVLGGAYGPGLLAVICLAKLAATSVTLACRFGGGVFSPGLVIGALAGGAFGAVVAAYGPADSASPSLFAMVGMGAVAGAIMGAPISTTLIVFELTGDYALTVSLMVAVALASLVTQALARRSFFHWQLNARGYDLSDGPQGVILQTIRVRDVMERMPPGTPLDDEAARLETGQSLGEALARLEKLDEVGLPVVDPRRPTASVGYLTRVRALAAYNRALVASHVEHHR